MSKILENSKYVVIVAVLSLMVAAIVTFLWGAWKTVLFVLLLTGSSSAESQAVLALLDMMDTFLIGTVLFIFSLGLYELFIGRLQTPEWLVIDDLGKLKAKLSDVIVVFMAIKFLDKLLQAKNYQDVFWFAASVAVVAAVLIAFNYFRTEKEIGK